MQNIVLIDFLSNTQCVLDMLISGTQFGKLRHRHLFGWRVQNAWSYIVCILHLMEQTINSQF